MKKKLLKYSFWIVLAIYLLSSYSYSASKSAASVCSKINVEILDQKKVVSPAHIIKIVTANNENIIGKPMSEINLNEIEKFIAQYPAIKYNQVYTSYGAENGLEGSVLNIQLAQKEPIARIFHNDFNFYLDSQSDILPRDIEPARVMVFTGVLNMELIAGEVAQMARYIHQHDFLRSLIEQIDVNEKKEFKIFTKFSRQYVKFGTFEDYKNKFYRLQQFYLNATKNPNFTHYKSIDLRFANQVVCVKR